MSEQDRRRFFRIDDQLELSIRPLEQSLQGYGIAALREDASLTALDEQIARQLKALSDQPQLAALSAALNQKLDMIIEALELGETLLRRSELREYEVNLSACGLGVETRQFFPENTRVLLHIRFPTDHAEMKLRAEVVRSVHTRPGLYMLYLDFTDIDPVDQEFLVQYIVRRQSVYLAKLREERVARETEVDHLGQRLRNQES